MTREQERLDMKKDSDFGFFVEERVTQHFLFSLLIRDQNGFARLVVHRHGTRFRGLEAGALNLPEIDQGKSESIREERPEFLHEIKRKTRSSRAIRMKKPNLRIKPHTLKR